MPADEATLEIGGFGSQMEEFLRSKDLERVRQWGVRGLVGGVGEFLGCVMSGKNFFYLGPGAACKLCPASGLKSLLETAVPR